jgi:hypothetical protein
MNTVHSAERLRLFRCGLGTISSLFLGVKNGEGRLRALVPVPPMIVQHAGGVRKREAGPAIFVSTFRVVIKGFGAVLSSRRLPGGLRQPVTLAWSLPAGGRHETRRARCSRSSRRRRTDETVGVIFQQVGVEV